jgi:hypothetical protein
MTKSSIADQKGAQSNPPWKEWFFRIVFLIGMGLVVILSIEAALRVIYREEAINGNYWGRGAFVEDAVLGYRHAPNFRGYAYRKNEFDSFFAISEDGLRQSNLKTQATHNKLLLLLGDSFTIGLGVSEKDTFAYRIQADLNHLGIGVINGAQTGYGVEQEVVLGKILAREFKPTAIVLSLFLGNDISNDFMKRYKHVEVRYGYRLPKDRWLGNSSFDYLRTHSYILLSLENRFKNHAAYKRFQEIRKADPSRSLEPTLSALRNFKVYCEENAIKCGVMIIPKRRGEQTFGEEIRTFLQEISMPHISLERQLFEEEDYFKRDGHWGAGGHKKAASQLVPFVRSIFQLDE